MENQYDIDIKKPTKDSDNWYVIQQESFTIDKNDFILTKYNEDFPKSKIDNYDMFELVLNRSSKLQEWYSLVSLQYTDSIQLPVAYKDLFKPEEYKGFFKDIQSYKNNLAKESAEIEELSNKFKKDVNIIKQKYFNKNKEIVDSNKFYPIITMNATQLPLSIQIEIESYTPKTGDITQQKSVFAREYLINYKRSLIEFVKTNPNVNIEEVIEEFRVK